jgi:hypothetical protein
MCVWGGASPLLKNRYVKVSVDSLLPTSFFVPPEERETFIYFN